MGLATGDLTTLGTDTYAVDLDAGTFIWYIQYNTNVGAGGTITGIAEVGGVEVFGRFKVPPITGTQAETPDGLVTI
jgi:hypothetical protein